MSVDWIKVHEEEKKLARDIGRGLMRYYGGLQNPKSYAKFRAAIRHEIKSPELRAAVLALRAAIFQEAQKAVP